jgi:hypothetical protein
MYKKTKLLFNSTVESSVICLSDGACIPFDPDNTDYANFKKDLADGAKLQDAEGNTMTTEQVNEFIKELP